MSHERWISVTVLTMVTLLGGGATVFGQESPEEPAATPVDSAPPLPEADLTKASEFVRAGDFAAADRELAGLQEEFPDDPRLLFMRGEVVLAMAKPADALPLLERASHLDGERPRVNFQLGMALLMTGARDRALAAFGKEIETNEDVDVQIMARLNRTQILAQGGDWSLAAAELEAVLELDPQRVEAYGDMAGFHLEAGDLEQAARSLEVGREKGFRSARHHYVLGARYYEKKAYDDAVAAYRRALEIDPQLAEAERGLGGALDQLDEGKEALVHLRRYLELRPDAPDAQRVNERIRDLEGR
ncbi:MAG: tetratricopeptide repeat protein [Planctomycetota bacterium]|jgi:superkiller protein 3